MKPFLLLFTFFSLFLGNLNGQEYYTVVALSGLSLRESPSSEASKIGRLAFLENATRMDNNSISDIIEDDGMKVEGEWWKVEGEHGNIGFAFSSFLVKKLIDPAQEYFDYDPYYSQHAVITNGLVSYEATFYNYQIELPVYYMKGDSRPTIDQSHLDGRKDTLQVYEYVFNELSDKLLQIKPKNGADSVEVYYTLKERIYSVGLYWEKEALNRNTDEFFWTGKMPYQKLDLQQGFVRLPQTEYELIDHRRAQFGMKEASIDLGEGWIDANLKMDDKPCVYTIDSALIKVIPFKEGKAQKEEVIEIVLSYGC